MLKNKDIKIYVEKFESAYSVMGAMVILMMACMVLLPSDVQMNGMAQNTLTAWLVKHATGLFFLYISAMMMQAEWIYLIRKLPKLDIFAEKRTQFTTLMIALGLFIILIIIKVIFLYVPFLGYLFSGLLAWGYFTLMKKMSQSKSGVGKVVFIVMVLIVLVSMFVVASFVYLIREG